jgi:6-phosphogluconolactonase
MLQRDLEVRKSADEVADAAAHLILHLVLHHLNSPSRPNAHTAICLSGGSTPQLLYKKLATPPFADHLPWQRIHWFWGDERYVSKDDALSNYRMVHEAMLSHVPVPEANIHRVKTELSTPRSTAEDYQAELQRYYGSAQLESKHPLFLISLLGLGTDGHTASLFPGTAALKEQSQWVTAVEGVKAEPRISLTYPVLNCSQEVIFLVTGTDKREILQKFLSQDPALPAAHIAPTGQLLVFADEAAFPLAQA